MLYERIMATRAVRRPASRPQCVHVASIFTGRDSLPLLATPSLRQKARAPRPGDSRLVARPPLLRPSVHPSVSPRPSRSSFFLSFAPSRLPYAYGNICLRTMRLRRGCILEKPTNLGDRASATRRLVESVRSSARSSLSTISRLDSRRCFTNLRTRERVGIRWISDRGIAREDRSGSGVGEESADEP